MQWVRSSFGCSHFLLDVTGGECSELVVTIPSSYPCVVTVWEKVETPGRVRLRCIVTLLLSPVSIGLSNFECTPSVFLFKSTIYTQLTLPFSGQEMTKLHRGESWYFCLFVLVLKLRPCRGHSECEWILEWNLRAGEHFSRWICI